MGTLVAALYGLMSVATLIIYAVDKRAAIQQRQRISERTLHTLALFGGWPGALMAQRLLRHKTRKVAFKRMFWYSVVVNLAALGGGVWLTLPR